MAAVTHNAEKTRFELMEDGQMAVTAYRREGDVWTFHHTEVPQALEGRGIGSALVEGALAEVKAQGGRVEPTCSFVRRYIERHPDSATLA